MIVDRFNTSGSAASGVTSSGSNTEDGDPAGELLSTSLFVYINNESNQFTSDQLLRFSDAIANIESLITPYGVEIVMVSDPSTANLTITLFRHHPWEECRTECSRHTTPLRA